jgi:BlaI family penicillinase repressor
MPRRQSPRLSSGEMEILSMLWAHGPVTLSEAHSALGQKIGYTTVQTRLNRLVDKGLVKRSSERPAQYEAAIVEGDVTAGHLDSLLEKLGEVQVVPLIAHLVSRQKLTAEQIGELEELIADARSGARSSKTRKAKPKNGGK